MHFPRQPASHRTPFDTGLCQGITSRPRTGLTLAIALAITLDCTALSPSTQAETFSRDSANPESLTVAAEPSPLPHPGNSDSSKHLESQNLETKPEKNLDNLDNLDNPTASPKNLEISQIDEAEMMRTEALETAIAEENFTPLISYCRMGECVESYYTFTRLKREARGERLYQTEVLVYHSLMGKPTEGKWVWMKAPTQVLCSTERPMAINFDGTEYIIDRLSPGNYPPGFQREADALYWAICHDTSVTDLDKNQSREQQAIQLGYDLNREASQTRQDFIELIED